MATIKCKKCGNENGDAVITCPDCGTPVKKGLGRVEIIFGLVCVAIVLIYKAQNPGSTFFGG